jgi:hypothetical protein
MNPRNLFIFILTISTLFFADSIYSASESTKTDNTDVSQISVSSNWNIGDYTEYKIEESENGKLKDSYKLTRSMTSFFEDNGEKRKVLDIQIIRDNKVSVNYRIMLPFQIEDLVHKNPFYITNYTPNFSFAVRLKTKPTGFHWGAMDLTKLSNDNSMENFAMMGSNSNSSKENSTTSKQLPSELSTKKEKSLVIKECAAGFIFSKLNDPELDKNRLTLDKFQKTTKKCDSNKIKIGDKEFDCECICGSLSMNSDEGSSKTTDYKVYYSDKVPLTGVVKLDITKKLEGKTSNVKMNLIDFRFANQDSSKSASKKEK